MMMMIRMLGICYLWMMIACNSCKNCLTEFSSIATLVLMGRRYCLGIMFV
jgi:hypothetical protein